MSVNTYTIRHLILGNQLTETPSQNPNPLNKSLFPDCLFPVREWLNHLEINSSQFAHRLCQLIPAQCPFARQITVAGHKLFSIPPLCKINPLYEELMMLRFRALSYLADECGEDISQYC